MSAVPAAVTVLPVRGMPEVSAGDDVADLLVAALTAQGDALADGDVVVVSSKVCSKAADLRAPAEHREALVLAESSRVVAERATAGGVTRIVQAHAGPVLAGAGIDASNVGEGRDDSVLLLPRDPDEVAAHLLAGIRSRLPAPIRLGVVVSDTAGRPWRVGQTDFALGAAGVAVLDDLRGGHDADGRPLAVTARALGDELASAADLVKGKASAVPAAVVRGLGDLLVDATGPGAACLVRTGDADWFSLGRVEAVRQALGAPPAGETARRVGIPAAGPPDDAASTGRAVALALLGEPGLDLASVEATVDDDGVTLESDEPFALGAATARLVAALRGEGRTAAIEPTVPIGTIETAERDATSRARVRVRLG